MSINSFLKSLKITPKRDEVLKQEAKRLAKTISQQYYSGTKMNNLEIGIFVETFKDEVFNLIKERGDRIKEELNNTIESLEILKPTRNG